MNEWNSELPKLELDNSRYRSWSGSRSPGSRAVGSMHNKTVQGAPKKGSNPSSDISFILWDPAHSFIHSLSLSPSYWPASRADSESLKLFLIYPSVITYHRLFALWESGAEQLVSHCLRRKWHPCDFCRRQLLTTLVKRIWKAFSTSSGWSFRLADWESFWKCAERIMVDRTRNTTGSVPEQERPLNSSSCLSMHWLVWGPSLCGSAWCLGILFFL